MGATLTGWLLGVMLGMRHALEPDHIAALSTLAVETRSPTRGAWLGAFWGLGHSASLFAVGMLLAVFETHIPERMALVFELVVMLLLIFFGGRALMRAIARLRPHPPRADGHCHHHPELRGRTMSQSMIVGLAHGLAGSGVLVALVMATLPTTFSRLVYIALFGIGSTMGMALLSAVAGFPLARLGRSPRVAAITGFVVGAASIALGVTWGLPILRQLLA
jgi:hypothetical protein